MRKIKIALAAFFSILLFSCPVYSAQIGELEVQQAFARWSNKSPHFKNMQTPFIRQAYQVKSLETHRFNPLAMPFYAVELEPEGFVIMNSDNRLTPVLAYSDAGSLNLDDLSQNVFRTLIEFSMERSYQKLTKISSAGVRFDPLQSLEEAKNVAEWERLTRPDGAEGPVVFGMGGVTNGPFLTTTWNQNKHYNKLCPTDSGASSYYDGHVPVGCVAVVGAQIMNYYEWPYRGAGSHSYTDSAGTITGYHCAAFSDPFDWTNMQDSYYAWGSEPAAAVAAVSELMYEIGVAVEMNYEHGGSAASSSTLNDRMHQSFLYDRGTYLQDLGNPQAIADQIRAGMLAGRPAGISISGHAIVADGHVDDGSAEYFHMNYGWDGSNDGWYLIDDINAHPAVSCVANLYPAMIPVNRTESGQTNYSSEAQLEWVVADVRTAEVQSVSVLDHVIRTGVFTDAAEDFSGFSITSTDDYKDWALSNAGYSGDCFYKQPGGYGNREYHLTSTDKFIPQNGAQLQFRLKTHLVSDVFRVMISDDEGQTFSLLDSYDPGQSWTLITADLSAYAGSEILIRFEYVSGSFYTSGGVWLDEISFSGGGWYDWQTLQVSDSLTGTVVSNLATGTHTLSLQAFNGTSYGAHSPSFTVVMEAPNPDLDGDGLPNDWETLYYGGATNAQPEALCSNEVNTVMEAYIAGFNPTDSSDGFKITPFSIDGNGIRWNAVTGRSYSIYWTNNLFNGFPSVPLVSDIAVESCTDLTHTVSNDGFYRIAVELSP